MTVSGSYVLPADVQSVVRERAGHVVGSSARRLLGPDATDAQWLDARRWRIGASELSAVVPGVRNPHTSPFRLWWAKTLGWQLDDDMTLRIGRELEPVAAKLFGEERPDLLLSRPNGRLFAHRSFSWLCCTPDFLAVAFDGERPVIEPVECKSDEGGTGWGKPGTDEVPEHHWYQAMVQCAVFGADRGHIVHLAGKRLTSYVLDFDPDGEEWRRAVAAGRAFWASLQENEPPDVDGHGATEEALQRLYADVKPEGTAYVSPLLRMEYDEARAARAAAVERENAAKNALRLAMGENKYAAVSGEEPFAERRVYKNPGYTVGPYPVDGIWPKG